MSIRDYYQALSDFCSTDRQRETLNAYVDCGYSSNKAGKQLGLNGRSVRLCLEKLKRRAAESGLTESFDATRYVDPGQMVHGKSTLTKDADGNTVWIKTSRKKAAEDLALTVTDSVADLKPWKAVKAPAASLKDQVTCYVLTDYHIGAYSWHEETGADWDLNIAERVLQNAVQELVSGSPDSEQAIFCQLGDFLHWDGLQAVTPTAKNILDSDGRFEKLTDIALFIRMVEKNIAWLLNSILTPLTRTNTDSLFNISDKDFSITDSSRLRSFYYAINDIFYLSVGDNNFHFNFREEINDIFGTAVELGVALLTTKSFDFGNRDSLYS